MLSSNNLFRLSGIVLSLLLSVSVITFTGKFIFGVENIKKPITVNRIYDPNYGLNISHICVHSNDVYRTTYKASPCFNKTLVEWYNPWLQFHLWRDFRRKLEIKKLVQEVQVLEKPPDLEIVENETVATTDSPKEIDNPEVEKLKESHTEYVYSILVCLLFLSAMAAIWEVLKEKLKGGLGESAPKAADRQCTLADFTINRHLRRESQQRTALQLPRQASLEITAKVTQTLIHQSSLDRAFPKIDSEVTLVEERRNSVPSYLFSSEKVPGRNVMGTSGLFGTRQSVDASGEEMGLDTRKKPRHFIRRH